MLKRAFSKLKLEHVVIAKGQFQQELTKPNMDVLEVCIICCNLPSFVIWGPLHSSSLFVMWDFSGLFCYAWKVSNGFELYFVIFCLLFPLLCLESEQRI